MYKSGNGLFPFYNAVVKAMNNSCHCIFVSVFIPTDELNNTAFRAFRKQAVCMKIDSRILLSSSLLLLVLPLLFRKNK